MVCHLRIAAYFRFCHPCQKIWGLRPPRQTKTARAIPPSTLVTISESILVKGIGHPRISSLFRNLSNGLTSRSIVTALLSFSLSRILSRFFKLSMLHLKRKHDWQKMLASNNPPFVQTAKLSQCLDLQQDWAHRIVKYKCRNISGQLGMSRLQRHSNSRSPLLYKKWTCSLSY